MAFQEKSAWVMVVALLLGGVFYFGVVASMSAGIGELAPPILPLVAVYTAILVAIAIAGHIVAAISAPREANGPLDERDRAITVRAGQRAGVVFGLGVISSLGLYLVTGDGRLLFYSVFASLMLGQLAEYVLQLVHYRTGV
jgi:hypothetical protein